jgi:8-oxo-dGTP pyrophosphatase MutT (NUDIX family)
MSLLLIREVARIVVLDSERNVLLVRYENTVPMDPNERDPMTYWVPPGGGVDSSHESHLAAAHRELLEETGLTEEIGIPLWVRRHTLRFQGRLVEQVEHFFLVQLTALRPSVANSTSEAIVEHRWWSHEELLQSTAVFFPQGFVELVGAVMEGNLPSSPITI